MAFKQSIPAAWIKQRPKVTRLGFIYNLEAPVGRGCPNRRLDVMLVQCMLTAWATTEYQGFTDGVHPANPKAVTLGGVLPPSGGFNNRLLAWIYFYQLWRFFPDEKITGRVEPAAADGSGIGSYHMLLDLNIQLNFAVGGYNWVKPPLVPQELISVLSTIR